MVAGVKARHAARAITPFRIRQWEIWYDSLPWGGPDSINLEALPSFSLKTYEAPPVDPSPDQLQVDEMIATAGEDERGHPRLCFERGKDLMHYPRAISTVAYDGNLLDGSMRQPKKRNRDREWRLIWLNGKEVICF